MNQQGPEYLKPTFKSPALLDSSVLQAARLSYRLYRDGHVEQLRRPLGIAVSRVDHRSYLIFNQKPVLLPNECFVPFDQIESQLY